MKGTARSAPLLLLGFLLIGCRHQTSVVIGNGADAISQGIVQHTHNPQVALFTITPHSAATVRIEFGPTTAYGMTTWTKTDPGNAPVSIFVAGMRSDTLYHMRAVVQFSDGKTLQGPDQTFQTGYYKGKWIPRFTVQASGTPQPGVELINPSIGSVSQAIVTDLQGNVLWAYNYPDRESVNKVQMHMYLHAAHITLTDWMNRLFHRKASGNPPFWDPKLWKRQPTNMRFGTIINPIKPLPDGDFLMVIGLASHALLASPDGSPPPDTTLALREINLAGDTVRNLTIDQLNKKLLATGYRGPVIEMIHHDVTLLPNGHIMLLTNATRDYNNLPGYPGMTRVIGDILVDLDANFNPVWTWSVFDHLDIRRHPMDFPDWTHSNAVLYTKDDGNLILSIRSQGWVIKIDYENGHGSGEVLWRLGNGGDLRLVNGQNPTDWNYGQHQPAFFGDRDAGVFDLGMMDNGNYRIMPDGKSCGEPKEPNCYSTVPIFRIDEKAMTATFVFHKIFPNVFSFWGGGVQNLPNGDIQIDLCHVDDSSDVYEMTRDANPRTIWDLHVAGTNVYRAERLPSFYPGVQW